MHADPVGAPYGDARVRDFEQQSRTVLDRPTICVSALIGGVLQELVKQITVGAVDFHAVEPCLSGVFSAVPVGRNHAGDLVGFQGARDLPMCPGDLSR